MHKKIQGINLQGAQGPPVLGEFLVKEPTLFSSPDTKMIKRLCLVKVLKDGVGGVKELLN